MTGSVGEITLHQIQNASDDRIMTSLPGAQDLTSEGAGKPGGRPGSGSGTLEHALTE